MGLWRVNVVAVNPTFSRRQQDGQFRWIADTALAVSVNLGIAAGRGGEQQLCVVTAP